MKGGKMRLIADGGSTKVHWVLTQGQERVREFFTPGMNPGVTDCDSLRRTMVEHLLPELATSNSRIESVEYYGAGCRGEVCRRFGEVLKELIPTAGEILVDSDMAGACRAVSTGSAGIVCILGTGANSCLFDGKQIIDNVPPLGYILGDEGSGAWLGKSLVADILKGLLPQEITEDFHRTYPYSYDELISHIYRPAAGKPAPNSFLAQFAPFLSRHISCREIKEIVERGFTLFFERNVLLYFTRHALPLSIPIYFVGSVAYHFRHQLETVADAHGLTIAGVRRSPLSE